MITDAHGVELLTPAKAAALVRAGVPTIANWRRRGILEPKGVDDRGFPLYYAEDVRAAERTVREETLKRTGADPRRMRKPKPRAKAAA